MMHIAIVTGGYYGLSGAFTNARELATHLADQRQTVTVLASDVDLAQSNERLRFARIRDIPLIPQNLFYFTTLQQVHLRQPIDVIQSYDSIAFLTVYPFARLYSVPTVFSMQASIFSEGRTADYSWLTTQICKFTNRFVAHRADRLICISQEMVRCALYAGAPEDRLVVIPNPIDLSMFRPAQANRNGRTCLYVGALRPAKGVEYLIRAIPHVLKQSPETRFVLVGDGPERGEIERLIAEYEIGGAVQLERYVSRDKLPAYYQRADLFVMPSLNEPQGIVALEAMACGLPVVASRVGGIPEMVQDEYNGLLVPPKNAEALAGALVRLLDDVTLRECLSRKALQTAEIFSWTKSVEKFTHVYISLLRH